MFYRNKLFIIIHSKFFTIGNITQTNSELLDVMNPNIYIIDIKNYTWVTLFKLTDATTTKTDPISLYQLGGTVSTVIVIMVCGLFYEIKYVGFIFVLIS